MKYLLHVYFKTYQLKLIGWHVCGHTDRSICTLMFKGTTSMMTVLQAPKGLIIGFAHCTITVLLSILLISVGLQI